MANFDLYRGSFKMLSDLKEALQPASIKNKVSDAALIVLLALNSGVDITFLVKEDTLNELVNSSFAQNENGEFVLTGKGAILAKSLERIL